MTFRTSSIQLKFDRTVRDHGLFQPGDTLIVAYSGGADSTVLLDLLSGYANGSLRLVAAHLNHCLRGKESDADETFCCETAARYTVAFESDRVDVKSLASSKQMNLEDAGRQARIGFLEEMRKKYGASAVVLAHHADDQAETFLMRLLRGSGMTGLSAMSYRNHRGFIRPLLDVTREEIIGYLEERGLAWREDSSNADSSFLRNRIRNQLIPLLEDYNPAICESLVTTAGLLSTDETQLRELSDRAFETVFTPCNGCIDGLIASILEQSLSLQRRILRMAYHHLADTHETVSHRHIESVRQLIYSSKPNSSLTLPHGVIVRREYDRLTFMHTANTDPVDVYKLWITAPGVYTLSDGAVITVEETLNGNISVHPDVLCLNPYDVPFPWLVRPFQPGDRLIPYGMCGSKKVKEIFIEKKIPPFERKRIPLFFCGDELFWIAGMRASAATHVEKTQNSVMLVRYNRC